MSNFRENWKTGFVLVGCFFVVLFLMGCEERDLESDAVDGAGESELVESGEVSDGLAEEDNDGDVSGEAGEDIDGAELETLDEGESDPEVDGDGWDMSEEGEVSRAELEKEFGFVGETVLDMPSKFMEFLGWTERDGYLYIAAKSDRSSVMAFGKMDSNKLDDISWTNIKGKAVSGEYSPKTLKNIYEDYWSFILDDMEYGYYFDDELIAEVDKTFEIENTKDVFYYSQDKYAYVTEDYELILVNEGEEYLVYKGYYQNGVGGVGIWVSIPGMVEFSEDGEYFAYYVQGYEWVDGPFICNMEGESIYRPRGSYSEYFGGNWISNDFYLVDDIYYEKSIYRVIDLKAYEESLYELDDLSYVGKVGENRIIAYVGRNPFGEGEIYENRDVCYLECEEGINGLYEIDLLKSEEAVYWNASNMFFQIREPWLYQIKVNNDKLIIDQYEYSKDHRIDPLVEVYGFEPLSDLVSIGKDLYVQVTEDGVDYYYMTTQAGGKYLTTYSLDEAKRRNPSFQRSFNEKIVNFDNLVIFDEASGNLVDEVLLDDYMSGQEYRIISGDFFGTGDLSKDYVYYMIEYRENDQRRVDVVLKTIEGEAFTLIDSYNLPDDYSEKLTLLASSGRDLIYDYYDEDLDKIMIRSVSDGVVVETIEGKHARYMDQYHATVFYDYETESYEILDGSFKDKRKFEYNPIDTYYGVIEVEVDSLGNSIIHGRGSLKDVDSKKTIDYDLEVPIGQEIIVEAEVIYKLMRVTSLGLGHDGTYEVVIRDIEVK